MSGEGITIVGLGPGDYNLLTKKAVDWIEQAEEIYLRTRHHPAAAQLNGKRIFSFDEYFETDIDFEDAFEKIVSRILELGVRSDGVTYAVPGHPFIDEASSSEIVKRAREDGIPVRILDGLSFLEPVISILEINPFPKIMIYDALELACQHHPILPPDCRTLITQIYSREVASNVKLSLMAVYPDDMPVKLVHGAGTIQPVVEALPLYEMDHSRYLGLLSTLFLPALEKETSFEAFQNLIAHLRSPEGCPWDRDQTHESLRSALLEETYEVITALDGADIEGLQEELGDLLLQVVMHAQIAEEMGEFQMTDVLKGIHTKIVRRHPHVFGDLQLESSDHVLRSWEKIKADERKENGKKAGKGLLDSVPVSLPALAQAQSYQARAARVGFDWQEIKPVVQKVHEELDEVFSAETNSEREAELGDLLFAVVNLIRWYEVDAETALRLANKRFARRFAHIEKRAAETGRSLHDMTLDEMDVYWDEAKKKEKEDHD